MREILTRYYGFLIVSGMMNRPAIIGIGLRLRQLHCEHESRRPAADDEDIGRISNIGSIRAETSSMKSQNVVLYWSRMSWLSIYSAHQLYPRIYRDSAVYPEIRMDQSQPFMLQPACPERYFEAEYQRGSVRNRMSLAAGAHSQSSDLIVSRLQRSRTLDPNGLRDGHLTRLADGAELRAVPSAARDGR
jgi:hypothetical protein